MSKTVQDIKTYLQLLNIPNNKINTIINRDDIAVYSALRDTLTHSEILELQVVLRGINNGTEKHNEKYLEKYVVKKQLGLKSTSNLEISSVLQMEPSELALNIVNKLVN